MDIRLTAQMVLLAKVIRMDYLLNRGISASVLAEFSAIIDGLMPDSMQEACQWAFDYALYAYGEDDRPSWLTDEVLEESGVSEW